MPGEFIAVMAPEHWITTTPAWTVVVLQAAAAGIVTAARVPMKATEPSRASRNFESSAR